MEQQHDYSVIVIKTILSKYNATKDEIDVLKAFLFTL